MNQLQVVAAPFLRRPFVWLGFLLIGAMGSAAAQTDGGQPLRNVVQLSASGSVEVTQDWLQMRLAAVQDGRDAASVQKQLQMAVDAALRTLRAQAQGQGLQVRTGSFSVSPRYGDDRKIKAWQGRAELVLEGNDFARITQAASLVENMAVAHVGFSLSKEGSAKVLQEAQARAVQSFQSRAQHVAQQFGFGSYTLREVSLNSQDHFPVVRQQSMVMPAAASLADEPPMEVEAGRAEVTVNISGSIQLQ